MYEYGKHNRDGQSSSGYIGYDNHLRWRQHDADGERWGVLLMEYKRYKHKHTGYAIGYDELRCDGDGR
jgi:hypothetical protein